MNRRAAIGAAILVVGLAIGFAARAMASEETDSTRQKLVTVAGTAVVDTAPDEAVFDLGVRSEGATSGEAMSQNATRMSAVLDALEKAGIDRSDIETLSVDLYQRTKDRGTNHETTVFVAENRIEVTVHDLSAVGSLIDTAVQAGADSVHDIRFQLSDETEARQKALENAVRNARTKADAMASAAGVGVTGVVSIREQFSQYPQPFVYRAQAIPAAFGAADTQIVPPSSVEGRVTVTVVWALG